MIISHPFGQDWYVTLDMAFQHQHSNVLYNWIKVKRFTDTEAFMVKHADT